MDQSLFAAPHGLSQRITSFIACACQGIHQLPLLHLIILIANAHHYLLVLANLSSSLALEGVPKLTIRTLSCTRPQNTVTFYNCVSHDAINVFDKVCIERTPVQFTALSLRPASRDLSGDARSGNINQRVHQRSFRRQKTQSFQVSLSSTQKQNHQLIASSPIFVNNNYVF